jgi:hypothetical protein
MWMSTKPDPSEMLRQGDLLIGLALPRLIWPLAFARAPGDAETTKGQPVVLTAAKPVGHLVVSQCCTIENQSVIALAEVKSTHPLKDWELRAYEMAEPSHSDEDTKYVFTAHTLEPFEEFLLRQDGRVFVADLTTIQSYSGAIENFQRYRVRTMTPGGRRLLRIRLAYFWGRVEREDEDWFIQHELPAGETPIEVAEEEPVIEMPVAESE